MSAFATSDIKAGDFVIINASGEELERRFREVSVGKSLTYVCSHPAIASMIGKRCKVVKIGGVYGEPDLIGLEPPLTVKNTPYWQNGCWYFPKVICELSLLPPPRLAETKPEPSHPFKSNSVKSAGRSEKSYPSVKSAGRSEKSCDNNGEKTTGGSGFAAYLDAIKAKAAKKRETQVKTIPRPEVDLSNLTFGEVYGDGP